MKNSVAFVIKIIGVIEIFAGAILGLISSLDSYNGTVIFFQWLIIGIVSGMLFIGFAEIIELLHKINLKLGSPITDNENKKDEDITKKSYSRKEAYKLYESIMKGDKEQEES